MWKVDQTWSNALSCPQKKARLTFLKPLWHMLVIKSHNSVSRRFTGVEQARLGIQRHHLCRKIHRCVPLVGLRRQSLCAGSQSICRVPQNFKKEKEKWGMGEFLYILKMF